MATAIKYRLEAYDDKIEDLYRIDILQEGYTGDILLKKIGAGHIQLLKKEGVIQYTSLVFSMQSDSNFEYLEFFQYNTLKHPVKFYKNDVQIGTYFIVPESYSEEYINPPYDVTITATDGLGLLANYTFENDGMQTYLDAIIHCLDNLGLDLGYSIAVDLFEENQVSTAAMFAQTYFDGTIFNGETCAYVLEQLLPFGATLTQHDNKWLIRRPFEDIEKTHLEYSSAGVYTGTSTGETVQTLGIYGEGTVHPRGSAPLLSLEHAWREVELTEDYGKKDSIINNSDFALYTLGLEDDPFYYATFDNWSGIPDVWLYTINNKPSLVLKALVETDPANYTTLDYIKNTIKPVQEDDANRGEAVRISFNFSCFAPSLDASGDQLMEVCIMVRCGTYYLQSDGSWFASAAIISLGEYKVNTTSSISSESFNVYIDGLQLGDVEVRFYRPLTSDSGKDYYIGIQDFKYQIVSRKEVFPIPDTSETVLGIRDESAHTGESITLKPADMPTGVYNSYLIYQNIKYWLDGSDYVPTENWSNNEQAVVPTSNVLQAQLINYYGDPKQTLSGTRWRGDNLHLNAVVKHALNYNRVFIAQYGTWYPLQNEYDITWREKWLDFPYMDNSVAYFDRRVGDQLIDRLNGYRATIDEYGVTFPEITGSDIFDKTNTTYWNAGIPNTAGDDRKWLFAELDWEFMVDYATDAAHGALFLKDFGTDVRSTLPILVIPGRTEAQQAEITDYLETYTFIIDSSGAIVLDSDGAYLVGGTI